MSVKLEKTSPNTKSEKKSPAARWTRTTVWVHEEFLEKLKLVAWWERKTLKDLFHEMIESYLASHDHIDDLIALRTKKSPLLSEKLAKQKKN